MHMEMHGRVYLNVYGTYVNVCVHMLRVYRCTYIQSTYEVNLNLFFVSF